MDELARGYSVPTEREPSTAIFLFFNGSPGIRRTMNRKVRSDVEKEGVRMKGSGQCCFGPHRAKGVFLTGNSRIRLFGSYESILTANYVHWTYQHICASSPNISRLFVQSPLHARWCQSADLAVVCELQLHSIFEPEAVTNWISRIFPYPSHMHYGARADVKSSKLPTLVACKALRL